MKFNVELIQAEVGMIAIDLFSNWESRLNRSKGQVDSPFGHDYHLGVVLSSLEPSNDGDLRRVILLILSGLRFLPHCLGNLALGDSLRIEPKPLVLKLDSFVGPPFACQ